VQGSGFRVQGLGFRVQGSGFRVQGSGFRYHEFGSPRFRGRRLGDVETVLVIKVYGAHEFGGTGAGHHGLARSTRDADSTARTQPCLFLLCLIFLLGRNGGGGSSGGKSGSDDVGVGVAFGVGFFGRRGGGRSGGDGGGGTRLGLGFRFCGVAPFLTSVVGLTRGVGGSGSGRGGSVDTSDSASDSANSGGGVSWSRCD